MINKLNGLKEGDRVRIHAEGRMEEIGYFAAGIRLDGGDGQTSFLKEEIDAPTFKIELLERGCPSSLKEAANAIIRARDHFAKHGVYDPSDYHPADDYSFDDWAADLLETALAAQESADG
jgi:hypothetical protein